jgi:hypothetical protein
VKVTKGEGSGGEKIQHTAGLNTRKKCTSSAKNDFTRRKKRISLQQKM